MTPPLIRGSTRRAWHTCRALYHWAWIDGYQPRRISTALWLGTGVHVALAEFYRYRGLKRGPHPAETFEAWAKGDGRNAYTLNLFDEEERVKAVDLGIDMLNGYIEHYGSDRRVSVIAREDDFQLDIPHPKNHDRIAVTFCGTFDLVFRDLATGEIWLMEHKTRRDFRTKYLALDDQASGYWLAATAVLRHKKLIKPQENLAGIRYNLLRKAMGDTRPVDKDGMRLNNDGTVSKRQPAPRFHRHPEYRTKRELANIRQRILNDSWEMRQYQLGLLPWSKTTTDRCETCPMFELCDLHEKGDDWKSYAEEAYMRVDPFEAHRDKSTEE